MFCQSTYCITIYLALLASIFCITGCYSKHQSKYVHNTVQSNSFKRPVLRNEPDKPRCGSWLNSSSGSIYYKPFEQVEENERCVWILGTSGAIGYTINLQYLGAPTNQPGSGQQLILSGVFHAQAEDPIFQNHIPTSIGYFNITSSQIVIITFHSGFLDGVSSTGFVLQYEAIFEGPTNPISGLSTNHILTSPTFDFKYPTYRTTYDANELAAIVVPPNNNIYGCQNRQIWYRAEQIQASCVDRLHVYQFNVTSAEANGHWEQVHRICSDDATWKTSFEDMILMLFISDEVNQYSGFFLSYVGCLMDK